MTEEKTHQKKPQRYGILPTLQLILTNKLQTDIGGGQLSTMIPCVRVLVVVPVAHKLHGRLKQKRHARNASHLAYGLHEDITPCNV